MLRRSILRRVFKGYRLKKNANAMRSAPTYAFTVHHWGDVPIADLGIDDLIPVCAPLWHTKHKTLSDNLLDLKGCLDIAHRRGIQVNRHLIQDLRDELGKSRYRAKSLANNWWQTPDAYEALTEKSDAKLAAKIHMICVPRLGSGPINCLDAGLSS